jgi:hypothetical protein
MAQTGFAPSQRYAAGPGMPQEQGIQLLPVPTWQQAQFSTQQQPYPTSQVTYPTNQMVPYPPTPVSKTFIQASNSVTPSPAFQKESFVSYSHACAMRLQSTTLVTRNLAHLNAANQSGQNVQSKLPLLSTMLPAISNLASNSDFQTFFDFNLDFSDALLRATAFTAFVRLVDSTVRSSVVFSQNIAEVGPLIGAQQFNAATNEKLRQLIDNNWKDMFSDILQNPGSVLMGPMVRPQLQSLSSAYQGSPDLSRVYECLQQLLGQCRQTTTKLVEIIVIAALSPSLAAFSVENIVSNRFDSKEHNIIGESGSGNLDKFVIVMPYLTSPGGRMNRSFVYAFNR